MAAFRILSTLLVIASVVQFPAFAQTIRGTVLDDSTSRPIGAAEVTVLDTLGVVVTQAISDSSGRFRVAVTPGSYTFRVLRIGYTPTVTTLLHSPEGPELLSVVIRVPSVSALEPSVPYALTPIVVEAPPVQRFLATFRRHESLGMGDQVERREFEEWNPQQVTDVVRRLRGFTVLPNVNFGRLLPDGTTDMREYVLDVTGRPHHRTSALTECPPLVYLDGAYLGNSQRIDINTLPIDAVEAIEAYGRPVETPVEYQRAGNECGVVALWTRSGEPGETGSPFELGVRYGGTVAGGAFVGGRFGIHLITPFAGSFEFYPALYVVSSAFSRYQTPENSSWMAQLALRTTILSGPVPLYLGGGTVLVRPDPAYLAVMDDVEIDTRYMILVGANRQLGFARPFVEAHLLDFFSSSSVSAQLYLGFGMQF